MKPYLTNKGALCNTDISLIEDDRLITNDSDIANIFIDYYTNIVEYSSGSPPKDISDFQPPGTTTDRVIENILEEYKSHPSIKKIVESKNHNDNFTFREVSESGIFPIRHLAIR